MAARGMVVCGACTRGSLRFCDDDDGGGGLFFVSPSTGSKIPVEQVTGCYNCAGPMEECRAVTKSLGVSGVCVRHV
jgi:hypothetical protein